MDPGTEPVVIFDGVCNLCSNSVAFIIAHERNPRLRFAAAQSPAGRDLLLELGFEPDEIVTFVLVDGGRVYVRSDAAARIAARLRFPYCMLRVFGIVPLSIRDFIYDMVARNRYRWFGKRASCLMPTRELAARFLGSADDSE